MSTKHYDITVAIQTRYKTLVQDVPSANTVKTQYPNAPDIDVDTASLWTRLTIIPGDSLQVSIGAPGTNRVRHVGVLNVAIFSKLEKGEKDALELADKIRTAFRQVTADGITYRTPSTTRLNRTDDGPWWQINVDCPFFSDEVS